MSQGQNSDFLVTAFKPETKHGFRMATMFFRLQKVDVNKECVFFRLNYHTKFQDTANATPEFLTCQEFMLLSMVTGN
jgi:hypothetical protein